jgi:hypothetical protein
MEQTMGHTLDHQPPPEVKEEVFLPFAMQGGTGAAANPVVATITAFAETSGPLVQLPADVTSEILHARTTVPITANEVGHSALVVFERGDLRRPIIIGLLQTPTAAPAVALGLDQERLVITAQREIVLHCGASSITLTRAGKVIIKGAYVLSRSSGANRIKGASVEIN